MENHPSQNWKGNIFLLNISDSWKQLYYMPFSLLQVEYLYIYGMNSLKVENIKDN